MPKIIQFLLRASPLCLIAAFALGCPSEKAPVVQQGDLEAKITVGFHTDTCGNPVVPILVSRRHYISEWAIASSREAAFMDAMRRQRMSSSSLPRGAATEAKPTVQFASYQQPKAEQPPLIDKIRYPMFDDTSLHSPSPAAVNLAWGTALSTGVKPTQANACGSILTPEFQDAQRFINEDDSFGPEVQVKTPANAASYISQSQFDNEYVLVAYAFVTLDSATNYIQYRALKRYTRLQLDSGSNCVYLKHFANETWYAKVAKPGVVQGKPACDVKQLRVRDSLHVLPIEFTTVDSIPAATRIVEGRDMVPFIGVRCAGAWCVIGATKKQDLVEPGHQHAMKLPGAPPSTVRAFVDPWFDEQHLAVWDSTHTKLRGVYRASIIPDTGLRNPKRDYTKGYLPVATVWSEDEPPDVYKKKFGYSKGWNQMALTQTDSGWFSLIVNAKGESTKRPVGWYVHTIGDVMGTARWDWSDKDEYVWIPCDLGCCLVDNGKDQ